MYQDDPEFQLLVALEILLSLGYVLKFFKGPNESAAVVFAGLNALTISILYIPQVRRNAPLRYSQNILNADTIPYVSAAIAGIYVLARVAQSVLPTTFLPIPDVGSIIATRGFAIDVSSSLNGLTSIGDVILFNALVASAEESFKVLVICLVAGYFIRYHSYGYSETEWVWGIGLLVVGVWTAYHTWNAFNSWASITMAFGSGLIILWLIWHFGNIIPGIVAHMVWNILLAASPYCLVGSQNCLQGYSFTAIDLLPQGLGFQISSFDILVVGVALALIYFSRRSR